MPKLRVLDLFAGAGGLSLGFEAAQYFEIVGAVEIDPAAQATYRKNHGAPVIAADIADLTDDKISDLGQIDILIGGPPCQAFSYAGKRDVKDPRASLFREYVRVLKQAKPKVFVFENVKGILSADGGRLFPEVLDALRNCGYQVSYKTMDARDFDIPQRRERVFVVGSIYPDFHFPENSYRKMSLFDGIGDLPSPTKSGQVSNSKAAGSTFHDFVRSYSDTISDHFEMSHPQDLVDRIKDIPEGSSLIEHAPELKTTGFRLSYARLRWDAPSGTITRCSGKPSSSRCIHPTEPRGLTIRECARLQSFPDWYEFEGGMVAKRLQIGNAVPPLMAKAVAESVGRHIIMKESVVRWLKTGSALPERMAA